MRDDVAGRLRTEGVVSSEGFKIDRVRRPSEVVGGVGTVEFQVKGFLVNVGDEGFGLHREPAIRVALDAPFGEFNVDFVCVIFVGK